MWYSLNALNQLGHFVYLPTHNVVDNGLGVFTAVFDKDFFRIDSGHNRTADIQSRHIRFKVFLVVRGHLRNRIELDTASTQQVRIRNIARQTSTKSAGSSAFFARFQVVNRYCTSR